MLAKTISKKYAKAIFEIALGNNNVEKIKADLFSVNNRLTKEVFEMMKNPGILKAEKKGIIDKICGEKPAKEVREFLYVLLDKKRLQFFNDIYDAFNALYENYKGIKKAEVISAAEINETYREKIQSALQKAYNKRFEINYQVKKDLLGGMIIKIENEMIDGSLKNQLNRIHDLLII